MASPWLSELPLGINLLCLSTEPCFWWCYVTPSTCHDLALFFEEVGAFRGINR